jgi:sugar-specific transcriptional regulator TrmB
LFVHNYSQDMQTLQQLVDSGLDPSEAKVYLALLELGPSTVSEITRKAAITRTLGYHVIQKLSWHGLVDKTSGEGKRARYSAEHPRRFVQFVEGKRASWDKKAQNAEQLLPELVSVFKHAEKPTVRYQDGPEGIMALFQETLETQTDILVISDVEVWSSSLYTTWGMAYIRERMRRKIKARILFLDTPYARTWKNTYRGKNSFTEIRWIKPEKLKGITDFGGEMNIWDQKMTMGIHKPTAMGVTIESTALVAVLRALFEFAWMQADEKLGK